MRRAWITIMIPTLSAVLLGCTERALLEVDPETAPGQKTPTEEIEIPIDGLVSWRDTTYLGYATPASSSFRALADSADLQARLLGRVETIPDSIDVGSGRTEVESFADGNFRLVVDTALSTVPSSGMELEVFALTRGYDEDEATWSRSSSGVPWTTPGGDLGMRVAALRIDAPFDSTSSDTLLVPLEVDTDSLLKAWRSTGGEPGFAVTASGSAGYLDVSRLALVFDVKPVNQDTFVTIARSASGYTMIFDPETPAPGTALRVAGLPAARIYLSFELPEEWQGLQLKGSTINAAELVFRPAPPEPIPFRLESPIDVIPLSLLADPWELGEKTPIGPPVGPTVLLDPEAMVEVDAELALSITPLVLAWSLSPPDSLTVLHVGVQAFPEGRDLGYWQFGSDRDVSSLRPSVRLLVTPRVPFRLP